MCLSGGYAPHADHMCGPLFVSLCLLRLLAKGDGAESRNHAHAGTNAMIESTTTRLQATVEPLMCSGVET